MACYLADIISSGVWGKGERLVTGENLTGSRMVSCCFRSLGRTPEGSPNERGVQCGRVSRSGTKGDGCEMMIVMCQASRPRTRFHKRKKSRRQREDDMRRRTTCEYEMRTTGINNIKTFAQDQKSILIVA